MSAVASELLPGEELVDIAHVPDGGQLRLVRSGGDFAILLDHYELMSTDITASEEALATMTCAHIDARPSAQLLIGGYGMGFTLRAALAALQSDAVVTVAEIVPEILKWALGPMSGFTAGCLHDPRVCIVQQDVAILIGAATSAYDAILLDVDNGPEGLTRRVNDQLYSRSGLDAAMVALKPEGILAIWSATPDVAFVALLSKAGFAVTVVSVEAGASGEIDNEVLEHVIIIARKS